MEFGIDNRAAERLGQRERQRRLAAGGGACNQDGGGVAHGLEVARAALVQPPRRRLRNSLLDQRRDRAGLMMGHPPRAIDALEQIGRGERRPADEFHANHAGLVTCRHDGFVARIDPLLLWVTQNFAIGFQDRRPSDQNRPSGVNAGYIIIGPDAAHRCKIRGRESAVIRRIRCQNGIFVVHAL